MKTIQGNLIKLAINGHFDVILHGCNAFNNFGAGFAKQVRVEFPEAWQADQATKCGDRNKMGDYSAALITRGDHQFMVVNGYTQYRYGHNGPHLDYDALESFFKKVKVDFTGMRIGYPAIGAGLAGGKWNKIYDIICTELDGEDHTFVEYK